MARKAIPMVVILVLSLGLLLTACGETSPTATPTKAAVAASPTTAAAAGSPTVAKPAATSTPAGTPTPAVKMGGQLTLIHSTDWLRGQFDPHYGGLSGYVYFSGAVYESLLTHDLETFKTIPRLAERWEMTSDATSMTLYLRKGVKWHNVPPVNGREFTADDVKWNFERIKSASPPVDLTAVLAPISEVLVIDKYTVKLNFKAPFASILWWLADPGFAMYPRELQEQYGDKQAKTMIGTGAFMYKSYDQNTQLTLVKNPDYYMPGLPRLDTVRLVVIADPGARLAALRTGQGDVYGLTVGDRDSIKQTNPEIQIMDSAGGVWGTRLNATQKPFDDVRVRQAVNLAIDRQEMIKLVAGGAGDPLGFYGPTTGPYMRPLADLLKLPGYRQPKDADIAEAKRLLAEAGYANGLEVEAVTLNQAAFYIPANEVMKAQLAKIGITWNIKFMDMAALSAYTLQAPAKYQAAYMTMSARGDPDVSTYYATTSGSNVAGWGSKDLDALLLKGQSEPDETKRVAVYRQVEDKLFELMNNVPLHTSYSWAAVNPAIKNYISNKMITGGFGFETLKFAWRSN